MRIGYFTRQTRQVLENAVAQWINGDTQPMVDLICKIQLESYLEGCTSATEVLEDHIRTIEKEMDHNEY